MPSNQQPAPVDFHLPQRRACAAVGTLLPQWHDGRPPAALQILPAALVSSFAFGSELLASAGWLHDGVLSFRLMGLMMGLPYANSLGAAGSLLMLPKDSKVTRGSEQLRSIFYDVMGVLVYVLLVSSVEFVLLLGADSALYYRAIGIAAFTSFQLLVADFDPDCQNATVATVVFVVTICLVIIVRLAVPLLPTPFARHTREYAVTQVLLNMLIGTWPLKQSERALLGLRGGAQLLNEFEARVSSKASARAGRREGGRVFRRMGLRRRPQLARRLVPKVAARDQRGADAGRHRSHSRSAPAPSDGAGPHEDDQCLAKHHCGAAGAHGRGARRDQRLWSLLPQPTTSRLDSSQQLWAHERRDHRVEGARARWRLQQEQVFHSRHRRPRPSSGS